LGVGRLLACAEQQAGLPFRVGTALALQRESLGAVEHTSPQQQPEDEQKTPKQKGLIEPFGHWHWK
jgi:hypothetical protein